MAVDSQEKPFTACKAPSDDADASPLDFSKRKLPPRLPLDAEDAPAPVRPRRMSLLSDALRSPLLPQDPTHAPKRSSGCAPGCGAACTTGILKHNDDAHALHFPDEPRAAGAGTRTHFVEPVKPPRRASSAASRTKSAPVSPQARKSHHRSEPRCPSVTFQEPHPRARSTSPRMLLRSQMVLLDSALDTDEPNVLGPAVSSASESDDESDDEAGEEESEEESDCIGEEDGQTDEDSEASNMDERATSSDEEASPPVPTGPLSRPPLLRASLSSGPASLAQITKRRALSFSDHTPSAATRASQSVPRRRSLAFAASPFELKERDRLLSTHRAHGRRRMVASPMVSSTSSPATNLFDTPHRVSSCDSEVTQCSSDAADDDDDGCRLQVRSPHLVQARPRSPKPEEVTSSEEDDEEDECSDYGTSSNEAAEEEAVAEEEAPAPPPPSHRAANPSDLSMDPCAAWANESIDADADDAAPPSSSHTPDVVCTCRSTPRMGTRRRSSVLHSLMLTEPTMHYTGSYGERLDTADELALAAEMLLLHKSPDVERDAQEWTPASSAPRSSDDEGTSSAEEDTARSPVLRRAVASPSMEACSACASPQGSGFASPQGLSFRRGRELQPHWRASTSPHHGSLSMDRRSRSDSVYPSSTPTDAPRLLRKNSYMSVTRSLHAALSPPDPSVGERPAVSPRYV